MSESRRRSRKAEPAVTAPKAALTNGCSLGSQLTPLHMVLRWPSSLGLWKSVFVALANKLRFLLWLGGSGLEQEVMMMILCEWSVCRSLQRALEDKRWRACGCI